MKRFLISRLSALGDVVCTLPAAALLKKAYPDCRITWAVDPRFRDVVDRCSSVDDVHPVKPKLKLSSWPHWDHPFDAVFDLQGLAKSAIVVWSARSTCKLGYHWQREGSWMTSHKVLPAAESLHIVEQYQDVVRAYLDKENVTDIADVVEFNLQPRPEDLIRATSLVGGVSQYVVVNPGAGWASKRWPTDSFAEMIRRLSQKGLQCVLIGGKSAADMEAAKEVEDKSNSLGASPTNLSGQTAIGDLIGLISKAQVCVGGDTGSSHLAAAMGVPCVGLYSVTRLERSCPYGQFDRCLYDSEGLAGISPDAVVEKICQTEVALTN